MGVSFDTTPVLSRLHVLKFHMDRRGENIVSEIDRTIVFVNPGYVGDWPEVGEIWFCNVIPHNNVYWADPLIRVNSALLMGLDERIRNEMFSALWQTNRKEFEKVFEDRYRQAALETAKEQLEAAHREEVESLKRRISELESTVAQDRILLSTRREDDEIELSSDEEVPAEIAARPERQEEYVPQIPRTYRQPAPGVPEMMRSPQYVEDVPELSFKVTRITPNCISSPSFTDSKYFVHISPNGKYLLVRPNPHGNAICINRCISVGGLGDLAPGPNKELVAEYSQRYGGMLIYL